MKLESLMNFTKLHELENKKLNKPLVKIKNKKLIQDYNLLRIDLRICKCLICKFKLVD